MRTIRFFTAVLITLFVFPKMIRAADWPQWRGPHFNGTSDQTGLPESLDPNTLMWKTALPGPGEATPVVVNERIYLSGYNKEDKSLFAMCLNGKTGKVLWQHTVSTFDKMPRRNVIASPSPVADKNGAIFLYSEGTLAAFDTDGKVQWKRNLVEEYGPFKLGWGYSSSPLLYDGRLYIAVLRSPEQDNAADPMHPYLLGVNPTDGQTIFKVDRPTDATDDAPEAYTTPIPVEINGQKQILLYGGNYLTGHDLKTGKELWRFNYMDEQMRWRRTVATPVVSGEVVYFAFSDGKKLGAYELSTLTGGDASWLWTSSEQSADIPSPVLVDNYLYVIEDRKKMLTCTDAATGKIQWSGQLAKNDTYYASPTAADGKLYMVNRKGAVTVAAADPKEFRILSTSTFNENPVDSTIAIADGMVYLRTAENLYCFQRKN